MSGRAQNIGFTRVIDTVELSDAFRRHAAYDYPALVARLVESARSVAVLSTWYDHSETMMHAELTQKLRTEIRQAALIASRIGTDQLILPVDGHRDSLFARYFKKTVMAEDFAATLPVKVKLQSQEYRRDLSALGPIDPAIKTALDEGVRGVARINSNLKYKWAK